MALAKESMGSVQTCAFKVGDDYQKVVLHEGEGSEKTNGNGFVKNISISNSSSPSSANSNGYAFRAHENNYHQPAVAAEEVHSLINFKSGYDNFKHANASSSLSFEQNERISQNKDDFSVWEGNNLNHSYQWNQISPKYNSEQRLMEDFNSFDTASNCGFMINYITKENYEDWMYYETTAATGSISESGSQDAEGSLKRPHTGENMQALKKQCTSSTSSKKTKPKTVETSKDPQSIAAKNRRERISERLKILQELVPNGSKVDLVTMLEKAISYVKFLQLQVKVLATDEFWPVQGGKAPDISQVREAIDAILSSQRDRNSSFD